MADAAGEVALSRYTAEQTHAEDRRPAQGVPAEGERGAGVHRWSGVAAYSGDRDSLAGETLVLFQKAEAQQIFYGADRGLLRGVHLAAEPDVSQEELRDRVAPLLPAGFEAKTGEEANEDQANAVRRACRSSARTSSGRSRSSR